MRRYKNAADVLPEDLLKQLQQYAAGDILYVPSPDKRQSWGSSGTREHYEKRNAEIRRLYNHGSSVIALADQFHLSPETIRKIIYK
jgi:Mor family transcriptional regulator